MALSLTRRQVVLGVAGTASAGVVAGGAGAAWISSVEDGQVVRAVLRRLVEDFQMADGDLASFVGDLRSEGRLDALQSRTKRALVLARANGAAVPVPEELDLELDALERHVLAAFVTRTDYLQKSKSTEEAAYYGPGPCASPWATFDLPT